MNKRLPTKLGILIVAISLSFNAHAQWLDWIDITETNLTLSSVANSDDEEKDMEPADLNNDGYTDIIVARKNPFSSSNVPPKSDLLLMNLEGELVDQTALYASGFIDNPTHARDVYIEDLDGDGWKDVIFANTFEQLPSYYRNLGNDEDGNWLGLVEETASRFPTTLDDPPLICAVKGGDIDDDGDLDLYFVNYKQGNGAAKDFIYINDGNGNFTEEAEGRLGELRNSAFGTEGELKDMDNDGDLDIIKVSTLFGVPPWNSSGVFILYNNGDGTFENWQNISSGVAPAPYMIEIEDFNQDGKLDLYIITDNPDVVLTADQLTPDINITYTSQIVNTPSVNSFGGNLHTADFDLDGDLDIAVADVDVDIPPCNSGRRFALLRNDDGFFSDPYAGVELPDWATNTYDFSIFDLNNDDLPDFILGKCEGYSVYLSDNCNAASGSADFDLDGIPDACDDCPANPDPNCSQEPGFPTVETNLSIPRQWNELLLESIRRDLARPTVHARNLFHTSAAMWDIWAAYKDNGCAFLLGQTIGNFSCSFDEFIPQENSDEEIETAISYAMYRILSHRFGNSNNGNILQSAYDYHMQELGHDINFTSQDYSIGSAAALGNFVGQCYIDFGLQDKSNEQNDFENQSYAPINPPLVVDNPGNPDIVDFNRWQPLTLDLFIDQSGNVIPGATPGFLSPEWGRVVPYALTDASANLFQRDGYSYKVYHDPGLPPQLGGDLSEEYKWGFSMVALWSSHLDPSDGVMWDISPAGLGNAADFPSNIIDYANFYNQMNGGTAASGFSTNPVTGQAYTSNFVPRGDYARVIAEFWADGPDSETPPGHWFTIINEYVADHPDFEKRFGGEGPILNDLEWYVKSYFMLGGGMHDAAISSWGIKGWYDYIRPISAIRAMADMGQSSDPNLMSYHPDGIPLIPNQIELVEQGDPLAGDNNINLGKIKLLAWRGHDVINNVDTDEAGVGWILAENWMPYQRPSFVTPNFAGYVSGHSTYSRTAATILTALTGSEYFPGGMGSFLAKKDEFLVFENGPSVDVELQWATYQDAANESALSRIWGGIHPPADDIPGRLIGMQIGSDAFAKALSYFEDTNENGFSDLCENCSELEGRPCNDGDECTIEDAYDEECNCVGMFVDTDEDGICDVEDGCPENPNVECMPYCDAWGENATLEFIQSIEINGNINDSGNDDGYGDYTNLTPISVYNGANVTLTPGFGNANFNENWAIWIDFNKDGDFIDPNEQVFSGMSEGANALIGSLNIMEEFSGTTRMRIAMVFNNDPASCDSFDYGEVEDYIVTFGGFDYCGNVSISSNYEYIQQVQIGNVVNNSGNNDGYEDFRNLGTIPIEDEMSIELTAGFASGAYVEYWSVWIDLNHDGILDNSNERVFSGLKFGTAPLVGNLNLPEGDFGGTMLMRIAMQWGGYPEPCGLIYYGEVEDYRVRLDNTNPGIINDDPFEKMDLISNNTDPTNIIENTNHFISEELLFPNPTKDEVFFKFFTPNELEGKLVLVNLNGQILKEEPFSVSEGRHQFKLAVDRFPNGYYMLKIVAGSQTNTYPFIKQSN